MRQSISHHVLTQQLQMFNLLSLMLIGKMLLNFPITWVQIGFIVLFAVAVEHGLLLWRQGRLDFFSYSSVNTALGVVFLMRSVELWIFFAVILVALGSKHFVKIDGRHFLNPSNVAVVAGLALFPYATYTTPEQWGSFWWLGVVMCVLGLAITWRVGRAMIPLAFMSAYALLAYLFLTHNWLDIALTLISGSFLLFIFFMLTDPRTTPQDRRNQILFAWCAAWLSVMLELLWGVREINMFLALFVLSLCVPLLRRIERSAHLPKMQALLASLIALCVIGFYFSPYNTLRNLRHAKASDSLHVTAVVQDAQSASMSALSFEANQTLYPSSWEQTHVVSLPLRSNRTSQNAFETRDVLQKPAPVFERKHIGWEFMHHGAVASGDIDHDGTLDLVTANSVEPLRLWLGNGEGNFTDATVALFEGQIPQGDVVALADMNNDTWLDLIVVPNPYTATPQPPRLFLFDPKQKKMIASFAFVPAPLGIAGSVALSDLNRDGVLDLYIAYSRNWHEREQQEGFLRSHGVPDQLWMSDANGTWQEQIERILPIGAHAFAGMTALFTDLDGDGLKDFMLGNDVQPSVTMLGDAKGGFSLMPKERIEYNAGSSMSYFSIDLDNDGVFELWENCISTTRAYQKNRYKDTIGQPQNSFDAISEQFEQMRGGVQSGQIDCTLFAQGHLRTICEEKVAFYKGSRLADPQACDGVQNEGQRIFCHTLLEKGLTHRYDPREAKFDAEIFPQSVNRNIALKRNAEGKYKDAIVDEAARFTGWSWAAYPFDIDNDGREDLFVSTGAEVALQRIPNVLLINRSDTPVSRSNERAAEDSDEAALARGGDSVRFKNMAQEYALASLEDSRGVMIADFDGDGDGDIVLNTLFHAPHFYENHLGGDSISVELRSKSGNYYAIGSRLELHTSRGIQTREVRIGGVWDSAQSARVHFGLSWGEEIEFLSIRWPDGHLQRIDTPLKNHLHVIFE